MMDLVYDKMETTDLGGPMVKRAAPAATLADQKEHVKALMYGEQGTGKTTALASMARLGRVAYIDAESGLKSRPLRNLGVPIANIEPHHPRSYDEIDALYWDLKDQLENANHTAGPLVGIVFDSMTEIQKMLIESVVEARGAKVSKSGMEIDPYSVLLDDYGKVTEMLRRMVRKFRDLPCHVGFGALQKREVDGKEGSIVYLPELMPKFANDLMGYVDVITCHATSADYGELEYLAVTKPLGKYRGKDRFGALPLTLANPTFDRIVGLVNDEIDIDKDEAQSTFLRRRKGE